MTVTENESIIVDDTNYLRFITKLIKDYEQSNKKVYEKIFFPFIFLSLINLKLFLFTSDLENLIIWSVVKNEVTFLPKKYKEIKLDFDRIYKGTKSVLSRQITCSTYVIDAMEFAVGRLYVSKHFNKRSKQAVYTCFIFSLLLN